MRLSQFFGYCAFFGLRGVIFGPVMRSCLATDDLRQGRPLRRVVAEDGRTLPEREDARHHRALGLGVGGRRGRRREGPADVGRQRCN